jgi:hypothetical protein
MCICPIMKMGAEDAYKAATAWPLVALKKDITSYVTEISAILANVKTAVQGFLPEPDAVVVAANSGPKILPPSDGLLDTGAASASAPEQGVNTSLRQSCASAVDSPSTAELTALADADTSRFYLCLRRSEEMRPQGRLIFPRVPDCTLLQFSPQMRLSTKSMLPDMISVTSFLTPQKSLVVRWSRRSHT